MWIVEYAQNLNGKFHAWIQGGLFAQFQAALDDVKARGYVIFEPGIAMDYQDKNVIIRKAQWCDVREEWV